MQFTVDTSKHIPRVYVDLLPIQPSIIGVALRRARERKGWSREVLSAHSGLSVRGIEDIETGVTASPRVTTLERLAAALGTTVQALSSEEWGSLVVREEPEMPYGSGEQPSAAEQLLQFLSERLGHRRIAGELTDKDLIAAAYTLARKFDFSAEDYRRLDTWRDQIIQSEKG